MKGVLVDLCNGPLNDATSLEEGQELCRAAIVACNYHADKYRMITEVNRAPTLERLQFYMYNAMLKYNKLGTF